MVNMNVLLGAFHQVFAGAQANKSSVLVAKSACFVCEGFCTGAHRRDLEINVAGGWRIGESWYKVTNGSGRSRSARGRHHWWNRTSRASQSGRTPEV